MGSLRDARLDLLLRGFELGSSELVRLFLGFSFSCSEWGELGDSRARDRRLRVDDDWRWRRPGSEVLEKVLSKAAAAMAKMPDGF